MDVDAACTDVAGGAWPHGPMCHLCFGSPVAPEHNCWAAWGQLHSHEHDPEPAARTTHFSCDQGAQAMNTQ